MTAVQQITVFIQANSVFAGPFAFAVALLGSLLGTNLIVPAGAILTAMGVLVGADIIAWTIVLWAACGATMGTSVSYAVGAHLGPRVRRIQPLQIWPKVMESADALFARFGFISILIGYFSGPLRAPIASVAGIAGMSRVQFELANVTSALVWATTTITIGAVPGSIIDPESYWLIAASILVPVLTIGISSAILLTRKAVGKF